MLLERSSCKAHSAVPSRLSYKTQSPFLMQVSTNCHQLKLKAADGKRRLTDVSNTEQLLRIIQSISSKNAEPFNWIIKINNGNCQIIKNRAGHQKKNFPDTVLLCDKDICTSTIAINEYTRGSTNSAENPAKINPCSAPGAGFFHAKRTPPPLPAFRAKGSQWEYWLFYKKRSVNTIL